jgi:hypothetical protein
MGLMEHITMKLIISVMSGAGVGYGYHRLVGCRGGACPITGNPYIATLYGAFLGFMWGTN